MNLFFTTFVSFFNKNSYNTDVYVKNGNNYYETVKEFISDYSGKEGFFSIDMTAKTASLIGPNATTDDGTRRFYMQDVYYNWDNSYAQDPRAAESRYADKNSNNHKNCQTDHTHLTYYGATVYAKELAKGIKELDIPIKFIGVGEGIDDMKPFCAREFVDALFEE